MAISGHLTCFMRNLYAGQKATVRIGHSLVVQLVKNLPAMQETWVRFLGLGDPMEKEMQLTPVFLRCRIPWTEEPGGLQSKGSQDSGITLVTKPPQNNRLVQIWERSKSRCILSP